MKSLETVIYQVFTVNFSPKEFERSRVIQAKESPQTQQSITFLSNIYTGGGSFDV
jgi:hypothetical protein